MTGANFPRKRTDGSFPLAAWFSTSDERVIPLVSDYLSAWVIANQTWTRIWRADSIHQERLQFADDFSASPCLRSGAGGRFAILLEGRPGSTRWKDWAVFMVDDLSKVFAEIKFERFESL